MSTSTPMTLGMVGLGRMGANMVRRVMRDGHSAVVFDTNPDNVAALVAEGAVGADSLADLKAKMDGPRHVWIMVPQATTDSVVKQLAEVLEPDDVIIDGGNSLLPRRHPPRGVAEGHRIHFVDCGTSGACGAWSAATA